MKKSILTLVLLAICGLTFAQLQIAPQWNRVLSDSPETFRTQLISSSENSIKVNVQVPGFYTTNVTTPRGEAKVITMPKAVSTAKAGEPELPMTGIPAIIGDRSRMNIRVIDAQYMDFEGIEVAPSKGDFPRTIDPADVPYTYGECYSQDAFFPSRNVGLYEPYIIRDLRGQNMVIYPYAYNPVTKTLRVYYNMTVEMYKVDYNGSNIIENRRSNIIKMDPDFKSVYQRHFINYQAAMNRYTALDEEGDLLIICYDNFISSMTDFVNWKKTRGVNTTIVGTSTAGSSYSAIKTYIQNQYNANNNLTHVLLVGDVAQIPGYSYSGGGSSYSGLGDNAYGQVVGSDIYNDVIIGRFSASTAARVTTQCNRTITYERDLTTSATWLKVAEGISRKEGGSGHNSEDDYQHMDNIRTDLLGYGYSPVYQRYANLSNYDGSSSTISSDINSGVGIINYTNHGQETAWGANSSGYIYYSNSHVNALTNENKLPFIWSVACLVGKYDHSSDCFAEAWMNATNNNNPTGAIGTLMSYISQPWIPPMWAQDECVDILVGSGTATNMHSWGGLCINGLFGIFDHYSTSSSDAVGTYQAWIVYGDPSLMVRTKTPTAMTVTHNGNITIGASNYTVNVSNGNGAVATITDASHNILGKATVSNNTANISLNSSNLTAGSELTLCVFGFNKVTYIGTINVVGGTQYNITVTQPQHGTISAPAQAYANATVTLTATPASGYCLSSWTVKDANNNNITVTNNQFTMPSSNVTVTATFVQGLTVTLAPVTNGSISADPTCALQGTTINLTATPANGYEFGSWTVYKTGDANTTVAVNGNSFTMPNYAVTVSATFVLGPTELTVYNGTATNGYIPMYGYYFDDYTKSECIIPATQLTSMTGCTISAITFYPSSVGTRNWGSSQQTVFLKEVSGTSLGGSYSGTSGATTVKVASPLEMPVAGSPYTITFDTPYTYEGGNLLIGVYNTDDGDYNKVEWYGTNLTSGVSAYGSNSSSLSSVGYTAQSFLPKTTFTYMPASNDPVAITVSANPANAGTVTGAGTYDPGTQCTLTASANTGYTFTNWTKNGVVVSTNASYSFTVSTAAAYVANFTLNSYNVTATANPADGGIVTVGTRNREDLVYDFENGWQGWTAIKGTTGTSTHNWMHNTEYTAYDSNGNQIVPECHNSSSGMMLSESYISASTSGGSGSAVTPDNYLVSPQIRLGGSITFYTAARMSNYPAEKFSVLVSESGNTSTSSFTHTELTVTLSDNSWHEYTVDLSAYSGMGYVAIRHWDCNDQHLLYIDDVTIVEGQDDSTASGNFNYGETCTLTATPNTGYHFVNWTENGNAVSSSANYSFTVTADRNLVANFSETVSSYTITATANPSAGGNVSGGGTFTQGQSCTLTATPNTGYTFTNWTKNGTQVSTNATYTFTVNGSGDYVANFTLNSYNVTATANPTAGGTITGAGSYNHGATATLTATANEGYTFTNWKKGNTVVSTNPTYSFTVTEAATLVANFTLNTYTITALVNPENAGTVTGAGTYSHGATVTLVATANEGYVFVNWTENGTVYCTNATCVSTAAGDRTLVANFEIATVQHTVSLTSGWNWWSGNQEITLAQVEAALGTSGLYIVSQTGDMASYYEGLGWDDGDLEGIDLSRMYKISASAPVDLVLNAPAADPSEHTITINNGANWIGYPVQQSMDINEALADLTPASNDVIKSLNSFAMYSAGRWRGGLNTLEPGKGYVYTSKATGQKTFVYPSQSRSNAMLKKNIVPEDNVWVPMRSEFRDNMSVVAKVSFADMTTMDEETEVVAFVGDECRGSAKLMYMEDTGEYVAFLLVYGQDGELVSFKVYNDGETMDAAETVEMRSDAVVGDLDAPYALHSVGTMSLFPNPVSAGESVRMEMPANVELAGARVEVYNALGALLVNETLTNGDAEFRAMPVSGVYTVRVTDRKGNVHFGKLIVR